CRHDDPMNENDTTPEQQVGPDPDETSSERPAPPPPPRRRLHRSRSDRVLAGVCGGIADYAGVNPVLVRIAFIVLSFLGAGGVLLYVIAALFLPVEDEATSEAERILRRSGRASPWAWVGIIVLVLFALPALGFLLGAPFVWDNLGPLETLSFAIVLVGLGVLLLRGDGSRGRDAIEYGPPPPPHTTQPGAQSWTPHPSFGPQGPPPGQPTVPIYPPVVQGPPPARPRKSPLVWYTLASALIALGLVAVADNLLNQSLDFDQYVALLLVVVGAGLVVGAWWGRARSLMVVGLLLIPFVLMGSLIDSVPLNGGAGSRFYDPVNVSDVEDRYELGMGELTIDLSRLDTDDEQLDIHASLGMGKLEILVPRDIDLDVEGFAGAGLVQIAGSSRDGIDVSDEHVFDGPGEALLRLDARVGLGEIRVIRTGSHREPDTSRERDAADRPREPNRQRERRDEGSNP
ncbi:MAG: PspC domain-containing protein, partial [Actinomycetota bacterium]